jgi:Cu/Ag efflux protein CusF
MRLLPVVAGLFLGLGIVGCASPEASEEAPPPEPPTVTEAPLPTAQNTYQGAGRVRNLTPSGDFVIIEHGPIGDLMGGMTMPFSVRSDSVLRGIAVGDSVRFTLAVSEDEAWIEEVTSIR